MGLGRKERVAYGVGAIGKDMVYALVSGFLMYYYNVLLGVSATFIGVLFMVARLFDAFNDPFMGIVVEKTHTRWGKFRPWIMIGTVINAFVLVALFAVPDNFSGQQLLIYISVTYIIWGMTYTIMDIPYWSMIPAISSIGKEREAISVIARSCAGVGFAIPIALTMLVVPILGDGNSRLGFRYFSVIIAILFLIASFITVTQVKEKVRVKTATPKVKTMIQALLRNDQALVVVVAIIIFNASLYLTQQLALYFFKFDIGNEALFGLFGTIGGAAQILAMTTLPLFRKKFARKTIIVGAIVTALLGYTLLFLLGVFSITNIVLLCLAAVIIFMGFGLATVLTTVFLADSVDYGEWKNNSRHESVIFSLQTFVVKLASAFSVLIAGVGLDLIGLDSEAVKQTAETLSGLRVLMIVVPMVGLLVSMVVLVKRYKLTENFLEQINEENIAKRQALHEQ